MTVFLVVLAAIGLAGLTYGWLERAGPRAWPAAGCRAVAWAALLLLLVNLTCAVPSSALRPLALYDGSLSMGAAGGRWKEALDTARALGEVRWFGDEAGARDTFPSAGRTLLAPALAAAAASGRPVTVVTDGEIDDAADLPPELVQRIGVRTFPRRPGADLALTRLSAPARVTAGDTVTVLLDVSVFGQPATDSVGIELEVGRSSAGPAPDPGRRWRTLDELRHHRPPSRRSPP